MKEIYVFEVMTEDVIQCSPSTSLKEVVKTLSSNRISSLVITENNQPIGIITERDMVSILADMLNDVVWDNLSIDHFMTSPTYSIDSEVELHQAIDLSLEKNIRHLPVVNADNKLVGILTQTDMIDGLSRITYV